MNKLILSLALCLSISSSHAAKLVGTFIFSVDEVQEVIEFSNAIFFPPSSIEHFEEFLVEIDSRAIPVPELNRFLSENGTFRYQDLQPIVDAIHRTGHTGKIVFMLDEPFWRIRLSCAEGNMTSCAEIDAGYVNVIEGYRRVVSELKEMLDDVEIIHIESFAELYYQKVETGRLILIDSAHYFSFDCYGKFDSCGIDGMNIPFVSQDVYGRMLFDAIQDLGTGARMVLIPGGFLHHTFFPTEQDVIDQLEKYYEIYDSTDVFGGIVPFVWSSLRNDVDFLVGARYLPDIRKNITDNLSIRK